MSKSKNMLGELAAMRRLAVDDDPHKEREKRQGGTPPAVLALEPVVSKQEAQAAAPEAEKPTTAPVPEPRAEPKPARRGARQREGRANSNPAKKPGGAGLRATFTLTPSAHDALKKINAFLLADCDLTSANSSMSANVAVLYAAERLETDKKRLMQLVEARQGEDRRR